MIAETPCIICGTMRVFHRKWKDKLDGRGTTITHVESVCPNSACQKIVDDKFAQMRQRRLDSETRRVNLHLRRSPSINSGLGFGRGKRIIDLAIDIRPLKV